MATAHKDNSLVDKLPMRQMACWTDKQKTNMSVSQEFWKVILAFRRLMLSVSWAVSLMEYPGLKVEV